MAREETVRVDGAELHCRIDGPGEDAPWCVFSNSLVTDLRVWDAQVRAIGDRYRVLRYDQRGHGRSSVPPAPLDFSVLGSDVLALLDHFSIERTAFVGLSMGVPTGLAAHARDASRFSRLVFVDGMAKTAPTGAASWEERIVFASAEGMARFAEATIRRWLQPGMRDGERGRTLAGMIAATPLDGFVQSARALQDYDYADEIARIRCPLFAIAGAEDGAMPQTMDKVFGDVAARAVIRIAEAGHIPNFEQPDAFNAALTACLSDRT